MNVIVFVIKPRTEEGARIPEEIIRACDTLSMAGVPASVREAEAFLAEEGTLFPSDTLYLTNDAGAYGRLKQAGAAVCVYAEQAESVDPAFAGASYIVTQPDEVDVEDYEKVYERLRGLPWTILTTDRIVVRETVEEDMEEMYACYDAVALSFLTPLPDRETQRRNMASYREKVYGFFGFGEWSLISRETGELIGLMGYEPFTKGIEAVSFGYLLHPKFRGRGLALEAGEAVLRYGEEVLGFTEIRAVTDAENERSIRLLKKLGFSFSEKALSVTEENGDAAREREIYIRRKSPV